MNPKHNLTTAQAIRLRELVKKRRQGMPIAYLVGYKYFHGLKFKVNPHVLIPRPETEWMVDFALRQIASSKKNVTLKILDVGTGCGCIAASIAKALATQKIHTVKNIKISATDISAQSLKVAISNARAHDVKIDFTKHDLLAGVTGKFDLILANLPYVPASYYKQHKQDLFYEPELALTDGTDESVLVQKLINQLESRLYPKGIALLEIDPTNAASLKKLALSIGFGVRVYRDLHGRNRFIRLDKTI